mmetsp:Transcript_35501/g.59831  ORF Transcript_35501/g.59831 Transcript_35501/m.59831 type:complete len:393 (+) Transcript_35501:223-1401(+)|eukprot:CAMPEP_0198201528 /NCGR_PEP_ID=MMETSP1445-20131203/4417_1 /TAXON_ID=36898 /ORGANISM="Pyramimonas sp., Strain CCMP2087" /LENGTH=392 /DNA_ID=CAMNT_0043871933 /DNA_START=202 /DNA_END=1380 /DNA_ORIENTATION=-
MTAIVERANAPAMCDLAPLKCRRASEPKVVDLSLPPSIGHLPPHERDLKIAGVLPLVVPGWAALLGDSACSLSVEHLTGGCTNLVYRCALLGTTPPAGVPDQVLLRVFGEGTDNFIDREVEMEVFGKMSAWGLGPELLAVFGNGRVESFITRHRTLTAQDISRDASVTAIAQSLARMHQVPPRPEESQLLARLRLWQAKAVESCGPTFQGIDVAAISAEIDFLQTRLAKVPSRVVFAHCDLQYGNIMESEDEAAIPPGAVFIDYEYAMTAERGYDIGNHFNEWAGDYHTSTPHVLHFDRRPNADQRRAFCTAYLRAAHKLQTDHQSDDVSDAQVEALCREAEEYGLAGQLHWGLWGLMQANVPEPIFNFVEYCKQKISQYYIDKQILLEAHP